VFILANLLSTIAQILSIVLNVMMWVIIIRALISWVNPDPSNTIVQVLYSVTEPVLEPVRRMLPFTLKFGLDISPLIVILVLFFLKSFLVQTLFDLAMKLKYS
jgi:YggT family protein